jgi:DNA end-binding protein Ku
VDVVSRGSIEAIMAKRRTSRQPTTFRSSWKGHIRFGLVSFAVQAVNALSKAGGDIHFNQLHAPCHSRIRYKKVCPIHGEVSQDEIVSGYEYERGKYVEFEKNELEELRPENERALSIDTFVAPGEIDPIYLDGRMYYLIPDGPEAQEPYTLFREAMRRQKRWGVGRAVMFGRDQLVLVRQIAQLLCMSLLNYDAEIRKPKDLESDVADPKLAPRKVELAEKLVQTWTEDDFDFSTYKDTYQDKLKELVEAKVEGRQIVSPASDEEQPEVINLMDALAASVRQGKSRVTADSSSSGASRRRSASPRKARPRKRAS